MTPRTKELKPPVITGYPMYPVDQLMLDNLNPRLVEYGLSPRATQDEIIKVLWEYLAVDEVAFSIATNGFFKHEPLMIERQQRGQSVVIEGNRRLAAVKLLLDPTLRKRIGASGLPQLGTETRRMLQTEGVPCIETTRQSQWSYLGFKHVNGPAQWDSYAKAQYIAFVHNEYGISLTRIAESIGDRNRTVERRYNGLMIIEQAERAGVFSRDDSAKPKFPFNYIYEAINSPVVKRFLNLSEDRKPGRNPVPKSRVRQLGELCLWLFGSKSRGIQPVVQRQRPDFETFIEVLAEEKGIQALRDGLPLSVAHEISLGDEKVFRQSVFQAKSALQKAHATLSTGFDPSDQDILTVASEVGELSGDLINQMLEKKRPIRRAHKSKK